MRGLATDVPRSHPVIRYPVASRTNFTPFRSSQVMLLSALVPQGFVAVHCCHGSIVGEDTSHQLRLRMGIFLGGFIALQSEMSKKERVVETTCPRVAE